MERISIGKLRYVEPVVYQSREDARKASLSGEFIVYALGLTEQAYRQDLMKNSHNWLCTVNCPLSAKNQIKNNGLMKIKKDKV